jgi:CheY-like chemotaxis protein
VVEAAPVAGDGSALKFLVVDDNATNRAVLQAMLGHLGAACGLARDGHEAVSMWEAAAWDAILMDIHMPGMDGLEASGLIRVREAALGRPRTPIVAVTASVLSHETDRYLAAGMDGFVAKPISARQLVTALEAALSDRTAEDFGTMAIG